ncbi:MAG: hypothetical protein FJZ87_02710 [Chloroflexi bacterium]|nr:hypothetical protein [Chloroflexota bacterium]
MKRLLFLFTLFALMVSACAPTFTEEVAKPVETQPAETAEQPSAQNETGNPSPQNGEITVEQIPSEYSIASGGLDGWFTTGQAADLTLSAVDFNNAGGGLFFNHPTSIVTDGTHLALADRNNNRVLIWNELPTANEEPDLVLGQPDFISNNPGTGADQMNWPVAMAVGGGKLLVADAYNNRILVWNSFPTQNGQPADLILSGSDFQMVEWPWGVWTDGTRLAVVNTPKGEVLIWNTFPTSSDQPADFKLTAAEQMGTPRSITSNGEYFIVGDHNASTGGAAFGVKNATFVWTTFPTSDTPADFMLEEWLQGEITDDGKMLMVSSTGRSMSVWNSLPTAADPNPDFTVGGMNSFDFNAGDGSDIAIANGRAYVALSNGNRIVVYNSLPTSPEQLPNFAIGSPDITTNTLETNFIISNPNPLTDGKSLFVLSDFDRKLYIWNQIPDNSNAYPNWVYNFPEQPNGFALANGQLVVMGRSALYIWNQLPLNGEMPDTTLALNGYDLGKISGMTYDGKYLYLADTQANAIYVWDGLPQSPDTPPAFTLSAESPIRIYSDGEYLTAMLKMNREVGIYRVDELTASSSPALVPNPNGFGLTFGANQPNVDHGAFNMASSAITANGHLFVADANNNRVLVWQSVESALAGAPFDLILGEDDASDRVPEIGADKLFWPTRLAFDGSYLWVGEFKFSERLVRFSVQ